MPQFVGLSPSNVGWCLNHLKIDRDTARRLIETPPVESYLPVVCVHRICPIVCLFPGQPITCRPVVNVCLPVVNLHLPTGGRGEDRTSLCLSPCGLPSRSYLWLVQVCLRVVILVFPIVWLSRPPAGLSARRHCPSLSSPNLRVGMVCRPVIVRVCPIVRVGLVRRPDASA